MLCQKKHKRICSITATGRQKNCYCQGCGVGVVRCRIPNNTGSRSRIFLSDSGCPIGLLFTSYSKIGNSCWNGTISFETFVETELSCCVRFPLILTGKFHSLYVKELESEILESRSRESESYILPPTPQPWLVWECVCDPCAWVWVAYLNLAYVALWEI